MSILKPILINLPNLLSMINSQQDPRFDYIKKTISQTTRYWFRAVSQIPTALDWISRGGSFYDPWNRTVGSRFAMPQLTEFRESFEQCCDRRAAEIVLDLEKDNRELLLLWSGGIDSTTVLISLLKAEIDRSRLRILLSRHSIEEYPDFFLNYIEKHCCWQDILEFAKEQNNEQDYWLISGAFGDNILSGGRNATEFHRATGIDSDQTWLNHQAAICDFLWPQDRPQGQWFMGELRRHIQSQDLAITTLGDFFWYLHFNFRWLEVDLRRGYEIDLWGLNQKNDPDLVSKTLDRSVKFFDHESFQLWSMNNLGSEKTHRKIQAKQYILDWTQDSVYYETKQKEPSMPRISDLQYFPLVVTEDLRQYRTLTGGQLFELVCGLDRDHRSMSLRSKIN